MTESLLRLTRLQTRFLASSPALASRTPRHLHLPVMPKFPNNMLWRRRLNRRRRGRGRVGRRRRWWWRPNRGCRICGRATPVSLIWRKAWKRGCQQCRLGEKINPACCKNRRRTGAGESLALYRTWRWWDIQILSRPPLSRLSDKPSLFPFLLSLLCRKKRRQKDWKERGLLGGARERRPGENLDAPPPPRPIECQTLS